MWMSDEPLQVGITEGKRKRRSCAGSRHLWKSGFGLKYWAGCTEDGSEGKIVHCCLGGSGGRHELLGGTGQAGTAGLCRCENFRLQGCRVPHARATFPGFLLADRIIFEPISTPSYPPLCSIFSVI